MNTLSTFLELTTATAALACMVCLVVEYFLFVSKNGLSPSWKHLRDIWSRNQQMGTHLSLGWYILLLATLVGFSGLGLVVQHGWAVYAVTIVPLAIINSVVFVVSLGRKVYGLVEAALTSKKPDTTDLKIIQRSFCWTLLLSIITGLLAVIL